MGVLLLVICFIVLFIGAWNISVNLFPTQFAATLATTIIIFFAQLIAIPLIAGILNALYLVTLLLGVVVMSAMNIWIIRKTKPSESQLCLINKASVKYDIVFASVFLTIIGFVGFYNLTPPPVIFGPYIDVISSEIPNTLNFIQNHSIWMRDGRYVYYTFGFHMIHIWGLIFTGSYALIGLPSLLSMIGVCAFFIALTKILFPDIRNPLRLGTVMFFFSFLNYISILLFFIPGKADSFITLCSIAAIYYFLSYWKKASEKRIALIVLTGLALGIATGAKLTAIIWLLVLAVIHIVLVWNTKHSQKIRIILNHVIIIGSFQVLFFVP